MFTPDSEPYLGRSSVYKFDNIIGVTVPMLAKMGALSRQESATLTRLQRAACELVPQGVSIALAIRELIRQGYLFGAAVMLRPLLERVAITAYLHEDETRVHLWEAGWPHGKRPSLQTMVDLMIPEHAKHGGREAVRMFNHLTHGDPVGASFNRISLQDGSEGFSMGKMLNEPRLCDFVCEQAWAWLAALAAHASGIMGPLYSGASQATGEE